jgi:hypothetical protein
MTVLVVGIGVLMCLWLCRCVDVSMYCVDVDVSLMVDDIVLDH